MRYSDTATVEMSRGAWLLACAGVPVGDVQPGVCVDPDRWPWADGAAVVGLGADGPGITQRVVPLDEADLDDVRAAATAEVERLAALRRSAPALVDGISHHSDEKSREEWVYLAVGTLARVSLGVLAGSGDPEAAAVLAALPPAGPVEYDSSDGQGQVLTSAPQVLGRYLGLLDVGVARRTAAVAAADAVAAATNVAGVVDALTSYQAEAS